MSKSEVLDFIRKYKSLLFQSSFGINDLIKEYQPEFIKDPKSINAIFDEMSKKKVASIYFFEKLDDQFKTEDLCLYYLKKYWTVDSQTIFNIPYMPSFVYENNETEIHRIYNEKLLQNFFPVLGRSIDIFHKNYDQLLLDFKNCHTNQNLRDLLFKLNVLKNSTNNNYLEFIEITPSLLQSLEIKVIDENNLKNIFELDNRFVIYGPDHLKDNFFYKVYIDHPNTKLEFLPIKLKNLENSNKFLNKNKNNILNFPKKHLQNIDYSKWKQILNNSNDDFKDRFALFLYETYNYQHMDNVDHLINFHLKKIALTTSL